VIERPLIWLFGAIIGGLTYCWLTAMTRKPIAPLYYIESLKNGAWTLVMMPPFRNKADAERHAQQMAERASGSSFRVVEG
jgi:hypothetical protein